MPEKKERKKKKNSLLISRAPDSSYLLGLSSASSMALPALYFLPSALLQSLSRSGAANLLSSWVRAEGLAAEPQEEPPVTLCKECTQQAPTQSSVLLEAALISSLCLPSTHARDKRGCASSSQDCSHVPSTGGDGAGPHATCRGTAFAAGQVHSSMQSLPAVRAHSQNCSQWGAWGNSHCPNHCPPFAGLLHRIPEQGTPGGQTDLQRSGLD